MSAEQTATSSGVGFRSERGPVLIGIMLSTALLMPRDRIQAQSPQPTIEVATG